MTDAEVVDKIDVSDDSAFDIVGSILAEIVTDATRPSKDEFISSIVMDMVRKVTL